MKVLGIIAEYNPFHNGHAYQLKTLKEQLQADYCIVAMSGNFTQRGIPAILSKFDRAKCALMDGADLVLELPTYWATSSAETFAHGGVSLLNALGVVSHLGFGTDTKDLGAMKKLATFLSNPTSTYTHALSMHLEMGESFPRAREAALQECFDETLNSATILSGSNNILAIEYLKALYQMNSMMEPISLCRMGSKYNAQVLPISHTFASASAIRKELESRNDVHAVKPFLPENSFPVLEDAITNTTGGIYEEDFSAMLHYRLLNATVDDLTTIHECNTDIASKIIKNVPNFVSYNDFCQCLKSKDITFTRISRVLLHVLLNIRIQKDVQEVPYARVLGFRRSSTDLLSAIKENASIPMITKLADANALLSDKSMEFFNLDLHATALYNAALQQKFGTHPTDEYRIQFPIID